MFVAAASDHVPVWSVSETIDFLVLYQNISTLFKESVWHQKKKCQKSNISHTMTKKWCGNRYQEVT